MKPEQSKPMTASEYYTRADTAKNYDIERFSTVAGRMFDSAEKGVVLSNLKIPADKGLVLDAGSGSGRFAVEFANRGYSVVACDYSAEMLKVTESKIKKLGVEESVALTRQDVRRLAFRDRTFDFVCCIRVTVNLDSKEDIAVCLKELVRTCRPQGIVVFDIVNRLSIASIGKKRNSMMSWREIQATVKAMHGTQLVKISGLRIIGQTLLERCPRSMLTPIAWADSLLSKIFPFMCVRIYVVLTTNASAPSTPPGHSQIRSGES